MPQHAFFSTKSRSSGQPKNDAKTLFFHPPSPFHGNFCNSIGICTASRFKVQLPLLYTARSNAYSEIGPEVRCDLSRLLARKITKRIHSSKPASLNRPVYKPVVVFVSYDTLLAFLLSPSLSHPRSCSVVSTKPGVLSR